MEKGGKELQQQLEEIRATVKSNGTATIKKRKKNYHSKKERWWRKHFKKKKW
jgi:hypothetical protein